MFGIDDDLENENTETITNESEDVMSDDEVLDSFILNEAVIENIFNEEEMKKINVGNERKVKFITKEQKFKRIVYRISLLMAKKNNDPEFKKWMKGRAIVIAARKKIMMRFKSKAITRARQVIAAYRAGKATGLLQNVDTNKRDISTNSTVHKAT